MLDDLKKALHSTGQESVINNPQIPNEHNEAVLQTAGSSIMDTLKSMIAGGQQAQVTQLASDPNHPATKQMENGFAEKIMQKFGISAATAKNVATSLIPGVLAKLGAGGKDGFNLSSLSSSLGKMGLDKDKDGDVDLTDIKKMFGM